MMTIKVTKNQRRLIVEALTMVANQSFHQTIFQSDKDYYLRLATRLSNAK